MNATFEIYLTLQANCTSEQLSTLADTRALADSLMRMVQNGLDLEMPLYDVAREVDFNHLGKLLKTPKRN